MAESLVEFPGTTHQSPAPDAEVVWRFEWDMGRNGTVESEFVATRKEIEEILGQRVYFGEILGKHSEVYGTLEASEFKMISDDVAFAQKFKELIGTTGYCPFDYLEED